MSVIFRDRAIVLAFLGASIAVPFAGCGDDTSFQPDASTNSTDDASPDARSDNDATTMPVMDARPGVDADALAPVEAASEDDVANQVDAGPSEDAAATLDASEDTVDAGGDATCSFGSAINYATQSSLSLFGQITYYEGGAVLPAGHYRVTYVDGCMKYSSAGQDWTIHAYADGHDDFWLGTTAGDMLVMPPGTIGYSADPSQNGGGAFTSFDDCVNANKALPPVEFDFAGGQLGAWNNDSNPYDNVAGVSDDGGIDNPQWSLTLLSGSCTNPE
jgi:hypothetical protein